MLPWIAVWFLSLDIVTGLLDFSVEFPNPQKQWRMCGRQKASYVCDPEFILERGNVDKLDQLVQGMKSSTSCLCSNCPEDSGIQIGIFLKNNLNEESSMDMTGKKLAETIRREWRLGTCEDDITIVLITQANMSGFSLGASVRRILPEETANLIFNECRFHFDSGYFYQGLESIVNSFNDIIIREQRKTPKSYTELVFGLLVGISLLLVVVAGALSIHFRQQRRRKKSCSNIYERNQKQGKKNLPSDADEQLEKLNKIPDSEEV